jgi:glutathione S-transferase
VLAVLEKERAARPGDTWFGGPLSHADVAVACVLRFIADAHPGLVDMKGYPALAAHATRLEAMQAFKTIAQAFNAPA